MSDDKAPNSRLPDPRGWPDLPVPEPRQSLGNWLAEQAGKGLALVAVVAVLLVSIGLAVGAVIRIWSWALGR